VLAVGGTTIPVKGQRTADICWKEGDGLRADNGGSTGGGISAVFPRPNWQEGIKIPSVNPGAIVGRGIPDIAANAGLECLALSLGGRRRRPTQRWHQRSGAAVGCLGRPDQPGARLGKRIGYLTPLLLPKRRRRHRWPTNRPGGVSGHRYPATTSLPMSAGYHTTAGYDAVSGWGTPDGKKLLQRWANH